MELILGLLALACLDFAALHWGVDSREQFSTAQATVLSVAWRHEG